MSRTEIIWTLQTQVETVEKIMLRLERSEILLLNINDGLASHFNREIINIDEKW